MKRTYKISALILLIFLTIEARAGGSYFKEKKERYSATLASDAYVEITNQYGDIEIISTDTDSIKVEVVIKVNSRQENEEEIDLMLDRININFRSAKSYVIVETQWDGSTNFFKKSYQTIKSTFDAQTDNIQVDYKVYMPNDRSLTLQNKFGNIYMGNYKGDLDVKLFYGEFRARDLDRVREIEVRYGKLKVNNVKNGYFNLVSVKYSEINSAEEIRLKTSSSEIDVRTAKSINLDSRHDDITIGELSALSGKTSLTDIKIKKLSSEISIYSKFGSIRIDECSSKMRTIDIEVSRADVNLRFETSFSSAMNVEVSESKFLNYSSNIKKSSQVELEEEGFIAKLAIGIGTKTKSKIKSHKGYIDLSI